MTFPFFHCQLERCQLFVNNTFSKLSSSIHHPLVRVALKVETFQTPSNLCPSSTASFLHRHWSQLQNWSHPWSLSMSQKPPKMTLKVTQIFSFNKPHLELLSFLKFQKKRNHPLLSFQIDDVFFVSNPSRHREEGSSTFRKKQLCAWPCLTKDIHAGIVTWIDLSHTCHTDQVVSIWVPKSQHDIQTKGTTFSLTPKFARYHIF